MENGCISREEHQEFCKRMEEENHRQNRRIEMLEETVQQIGKLTASVEKMATSLQGMVREQEQQGKRIVALESRDGEMWRKVVTYAVTALAGAVIGFVVKQIGM